MQYILEYSNWLNQPAKIELDLVKINENFGLGDFLHACVDVVSAVADTVVPGSGAVIDFIHAGSYFIESMKNSGSAQLSLIMQGVITLATILAIGPLKTSCDFLKAEVKKIFEAFLPNAAKATINSAKAAASTASSALNKIISMVGQISTGVVNLIKSSANSSLGKWIIEKFSGIDAAVKWFTTFLTSTLPSKLKEILSLLAKLNPTSTGAAGHETAELITKASTQNFIGSKAASSGLDIAANKTKQIINSVTSNSNQQISQLSAGNQQTQQKQHI